MARTFQLLSSCLSQVNSHNLGSFSALILTLKIILSTMLFCFLSGGSMALASDYPERTISPFEAEEMENKDKDYYKAKERERALKDSVRVRKGKQNKTNNIN